MIYLIAAGDTVYAYGDEKSIKFALGLSDDDVIPPSVFQVSESEWDAAGNTAYIEGDKIVIGAPLDMLKANKLNEINALYQQAIATLTPTYPDDERLTFDKQEQEARAWLADNTTPTPFIDALAAGRQMEKAELVSRIIAKADAFALASGSLTGQRQRYEDLLDAAETAEEVEAIVPEYSLPGSE